MFVAVDQPVRLIRSSMSSVGAVNAAGPDSDIGKQIFGAHGGSVRRSALAAALAGAFYRLRLSVTPLTWH
jgi:hypothetical protein